MKKVVVLLVLVFGGSALFAQESQNRRKPVDEQGALLSLFVKKNNNVENKLYEEEHVDLARVIDSVQFHNKQDEVIQDILDLENSKEKNLLAALSLQQLLSFRIDDTVTTYQGDTYLYTGYCSPEEYYRHKLLRKKSILLTYLTSAGFGGKKLLLPPWLLAFTGALLSGVYTGAYFAVRDGPHESFLANLFHALFISEHGGNAASSIGKGIDNVASALNVFNYLKTGQAVYIDPKAEKNINAAVWDARKSYGRDSKKTPMSDVAKVFRNAGIGALLFSSIGYIPFYKHVKKLRESVQKNRGLFFNKLWRMTRPYIEMYQENAHEIKPVAEIINKWVPEIDAMLADKPMPENSEAQHCLYLFYADINDFIKKALK